MSASGGSASGGLHSAGRVSASGRGRVGQTPRELGKRAVRTLLECFLVTTNLHDLKS